MISSIRLNKYLAQKGYCSRRKADEFIASGKVMVNGKIVKELGTKVDPEKDKVEVADRKAHKQASNDNQRKVYIALNKPIDYITSTTGDQGQSVMILITPENQLNSKTSHESPITNHRLYPVGRLDKDSEGLVLLTNDGELTQTLTHPSFEHEKEYEITIDKQLSTDARKILQSGMIIDETTIEGITITKEWNQGKRVVITIVLKEGKNRQLRKMFGRLGYHVIALKRTRIGKTTLATLPIGRWRFVEKKNII